MAPVQNPTTEEKRVLGKALFWDEQLSSDDTVACGTCHIPAVGGGDPRFGNHPGPDGVFLSGDDTIGSPGIVRRNANNEPVDDAVFGFEAQVTPRGSPGIFMSAYATDLFWDGRAREQFIDPLDDVTVIIDSGGGLESQAVVPILSAVEMAHEGRSWDQVTTKLANVTPLALAGRLPPDVAAALESASSYPGLFAAAFGSEEITPARIGLALGTYQRTLVPDQTPWDLYVAGDSSALTPEQASGWEDFANDTLCTNCHVPPHFTDHDFYNIGLRPAAEDDGRMAVTGLADDFGRFKTPSLRNSGLRRSMTHVGWIRDTHDAVEFYNAEFTDFLHTQFRDDQSPVPTDMPGMFHSYIHVHVFPDESDRKKNTIDFLVNGLTDPRVAQELFPFDRPILRSETLRILSYNTAGGDWTEARADALANIMRNSGADIIALQNTSADSALDLHGRLSNSYDLVEFGDEAADSPVLLKQNTFRIVGEMALGVNVECAGQGAINRLRLEHPESGERLLFYNVTFCDPNENIAEGDSAATRNGAHAAQLIDTIIDDRRSWSLPFIVAGELNNVAASESIRMLLANESTAEGATNPLPIHDAWTMANGGANNSSTGQWVLTAARDLVPLTSTFISNSNTATAADSEPLLAAIGIDTNPLPAEPIDDEAPTVPEGLVMSSVSDTTVTLSWQDASDGTAVVAYRIYRDGELRITTAQNPFEDRGLSEQTSYSYAVSAMDAEGNESTKSAELDVTTMEAPPPPAPPPRPQPTGGGSGAFGPAILTLLSLLSGAAVLRTRRRSTATAE